MPLLYVSCAGQPWRRRSALWAISLPSAGGDSWPGDDPQPTVAKRGGSSGAAAYLACLSDGVKFELELDGLLPDSAAAAAAAADAVAPPVNGVSSADASGLGGQVLLNGAAGANGASQLAAPPNGDSAAGAVMGLGDAVWAGAGSQATAADGGALSSDVAAEDVQVLEAAAADMRAEPPPGGGPAVALSLTELISQLTTFLLENGASHYEVASMASAWQQSLQGDIDVESAAAVGDLDAGARQQRSSSGSSGGGSGGGGSGNGALRLGTGVVAQAAGLVDGEGGDWRENLGALVEAGFTGSDLANMAVKMPQLLDMCFSADVVPVMELMRQELGFRPTDARRVLRRAPQVLLPRQDGSTPVDTIAALQALGLKPKMVSMEVIRWPRLLTYSPASLMELATWLGSAEVGMRAASDDSSAVSLNVLRQAPWLAEHDLETQLRPVARYLQESLGIRDMQRVLRAYPQILCCSITKDLEPRVWFLTEEVGINEEDVPRVVQTFPLLFAVPVERMRGVYGLLASELLITRPDITKIVRAFPSLLGLEPEKHVRAVVAYMRSLGIQNIGRFVSRLPPVLGYDVSNNLMPKMDYLVAMMGLSVYDVLTFPAYFSYPLESIIEPRTEFLKLRRRPIAVVGLNMALTSGDADFAKKIAKVRPELYASFKAAYMKHRAEVQAGTMKGEDLLEMLGLDMLGGKPLGSLGGLSTSSNVQEVTSARQLADDEVAAKFGPDGSAQQQDGERDAQGG